MKTFKLKHNGIDITDWCKNYSYMFRKLYSNFELSQDKGFEKELREKYNLDSWFFSSCLVEVKMKLEQNATQKKNKLNRITAIEKELQSNQFVGIKGKRTKFKLMTKLNYLKTHVNKEITFGTKALLRRISYLPNYIKQLKGSVLTETDLLKTKSIQLELIKAEKELVEAKNKYHQNRILAIISVGEANQKSNRKFDFDFVNKKMVFKPQRGVKIPIEFKCSKSQYSDLVKLHQQIGEQAITVRIDNDYVYITFDNEKLNGYAFNEHEYFKELKLIPTENKQQRKDCYKKWITEQENRKYVGKNVNRFLGIDLNPEYIGFSVLQKVSQNKFNILHKQCIALSGLNTKIGLSSTNPQQIYQNNKRVHEIYEAWKTIFKTANRFKVSNCVIEDLDFKEKGVNENAKEANRKTKNLWHRQITTTTIQKYCHELGINLIKVNACYSSFIGNIKNKLFDPVSASIEIGRRGITKYLKGGFYPKLERIDLDTMYLLGLDVLRNTVSNWVVAYKHFKTSGLRYRRELQNFVESNLMSEKSYVKLYNFI